MASRLSPDDIGLQLLENAAATAGALIGLILIFGAVSGAHFNPVVTLVDRAFGSISTRDTGLYIAAQIIGGCLGAVVANLMFELPAVEWSTTERSSGALWLSEVVATVGLLLVIHGCVRTGRANVVAFAVGALDRRRLLVHLAPPASPTPPSPSPAPCPTRSPASNRRRHRCSSSCSSSAPSSPTASSATSIRTRPEAQVTDGHHRRAHPRPTAPPHSPSAPSSRTSSPARSGPRPSSVSCTDSLDQLLPQAKITTFTPIFAERFARDRLTALAKIEGRLPVTTPSVLFLCVHNAGRSQMAAGWLQHLAGDRVSVYSGGSEPASEINPAAIDAMAEVGIDITANYPKPWTDEIVRAADVVVTMGCGDACPIFPGKRYEDWELDDPAGLDVDAVRSHSRRDPPPCRAAHRQPRAAARLTYDAIGVAPSGNAAARRDMVRFSRVWDAGLDATADASTGRECPRVVRVPARGYTGWPVAVATAGRESRHRRRGCSASAATSQRCGGAAVARRSASSSSR